MPRSPRSSRHTREGMMLTILWTVLIVAIGFAHLWKLSSLPEGLFQDEAAIGLNAAIVAETGKDEHGAFLPLYFTSFGDYKAPVYTYGAAMLFLFVEPTTFMLRFVSFKFFALLLISMVMLCAALHRKQPVLLFYTLLAAGMLPWWFTLSRVAFEIISQPAIMAACLLCTFYAFAERRGDRRWAAAAGALLGLSIYTYPTARLLSPLCGLLIAGFFFRKANWRTSVAFCLGSAATLIPYFVYALQQGSNLTSRFNGLTYLYDSSLSLSDKVSTFLGLYASYWGLPFLIVSGDPNHRHGMGMGGTLYITVLTLALVGLAALFVDGKQVRNRRFVWFSLCGLIVSPLGAALTREASPHGLRSMLMGIFFLLLSLEGIQAVLRRAKTRRLRTIIVTLIFVVLVTEITFYTTDYFGRYAAESQNYFDSSGTEQGLHLATSQGPASIIASDKMNYAIVRFHELTLPAGHPPIVFGKPEPREGSCLLYLPSDDSTANASGTPYKELTPPGAIVRTRCY